MITEELTALWAFVEITYRGRKKECHSTRCVSKTFLSAPAYANVSRTRMTEMMHEKIFLSSNQIMMIKKRMDK